MWRAPRAVVLSATHPEPPFMPAQCTAAEAVEKEASVPVMQGFELISRL